MSKTATMEPVFVDGQRVLCRLGMTARPGTVKLCEPERGRYQVHRDGEALPVWCTGGQLEAMGERYEQPRATTGPAFSVELPAPSPCPLCGRC